MLVEIYSGILLFQRNVVPSQLQLRYDGIGDSSDTERAGAFSLRCVKN